MALAIWLFRYLRLGESSGGSVKLDADHKFDGILGFHDGCELNLARVGIKCR